jgi:polysaccharide deacetylase 2 family uncharacterized protein YibQ
MKLTKLAAPLASQRALTRFKWKMALSLFIFASIQSTVWAQDPGNAANPANHPEASHDNKATVSRAAIVIDDFGNNSEGTGEMLQMPIPITAAVMPFLRTTKNDAEAAHKAGYDVLVHLPMEPKTGRASWLGPGAIMTNLSDEEIRDKVRKAIDAVPYAIGINNHTGSKATGDIRVMRAIMDVCKERGLLFLDSHTNYRSVACKAAAEKNVPCLENEIFLDDHALPAHISKQLKLLADRSKQNGTAIAIGHVGLGGKIMAGTLRNMIPQLTDRIQFVSISQLVPVSNPLTP